MWKHGRDAKGVASPKDRTHNWPPKRPAAMPQQSTPRRSGSSTRREPHDTSQTPDLFGFTAPASATDVRKRPARGPAEWPAAGSTTTARGRRSATPATAAPDRVRVPMGPGLSGGYTRAGATLRRPDGIALVVCQSNKPALGSRDSTRYVKTARPGGGRPEYAGNLYGPASGGADDLDNCQFQDRASGVRYSIRLTSPGCYVVSPVRRRRKRSGT